MKGKKIIIISIIINILLIGTIYNFIKKDYLNNKKITIKAMTDTEYEGYITSLNQSHINYVNYIEESKTKIASAITDMGVNTSNDASPETMSSNIRSIARNASSISYDNTNSSLKSTTVQGAVDEINSEVTEFKTALPIRSNYSTTVAKTITTGIYTAQYDCCVSVRTDTNTTAYGIHYIKINNFDVTIHQNPSVLDGYIFFNTYYLNKGDTISVSGEIARSVMSVYYIK